MPKESFLKLPIKKQDSILKIVRQEFTNNHYDDVSINSIVKKCNIARGSFYNYFENMQDLFLYCLDDYFLSLKYNLISSLEKSGWDILNGVTTFFKLQFSIINRGLETLILNLLTVELEIMRSSEEQKKYIHLSRLQENNQLLRMLRPGNLKNESDLPILMELALTLVINELIDATIFKMSYEEATSIFEKKIEFLRRGAYHE